MKPPKGYFTSSGQVSNLMRSLYGLKQAFRQWNRELTQDLITYAFDQSKHDTSIFTKHTAKGFIAVLVYVDELLFTAMI